MYSTLERELWAHQRDALEKGDRLGRLALFMEPGTGKTGTTIHLLRKIYNRRRGILSTLVFAPPVVVKNWKREVIAFSKIPPERVVLLQGSGKKRLEILREARRRFNGFFIAVTNYEAVQMDDLFQEIMDWQPRVLVCDEVHQLKNPQALRTKKVCEISEGRPAKKGQAATDPVEHCFILTGTPVLNNPMDVFAPFRILDQGRTFGKNFFAFRNLYFWDKNAGMPKQKYFPFWVPKSTTEADLGRKMSEWSFQAKKSECLTLPPFVKIRIDVELGPEQNKAYQEMLKHYVTFINQEAVVAQLAITKTLRLQQILSGFVRTEDGTDIPFKKNPRLDALSDLLENLCPTQKVLVWADFKQNYADIGSVCERLSIPFVAITGEQSAKEKEESERAFQHDDSVRILIGHAKAGGVGVNLTAASASVYYTRSYSKVNEDQSEARNYRGGSERHQKITRYDLVAPETLDDVVLQALQNKTNIAESILSFARGIKV